MKVVHVHRIRGIGGSERHLLTLLDIAGSGDGDSLALAPEGYTAGSKSLTEAGEWRMANRAVPAAAVWKALGKPDAVINAIRAENS